MYGNIHVVNIREFDCVVRVGFNRLAQVFPHLCRDHVESRAEFNIAHVITAQVDVHQSGNFIILGRIPVVFHALD